MALLRITHCRFLTIVLLFTSEHFSAGLSMVAAVLLSPGSYRQVASMSDRICLIVDDEPAIRGFLRVVLKAAFPSVFGSRKRN